MINRSRVLVLALLAVFQVIAADQPLSVRHPEERDGLAQIIHGGEILRDRATNSASGRHLWPLYSTPEVRMNYFEVTGPSGLHFHPDADHRLYVLEGKLVITVGTNRTTATIGDFVIIPKGVRHRYDVPAKGDRALMLTFDAPPYDPRKTVNLESSNVSK
jgi:quercetin dioxygenase-like cupin family protein